MNQEKRNRCKPRRHWLPVVDWAASYKREFLLGDLNAGIIVAIVLIPQSIAYAMVAGLPPQMGLYASILPVILYGLFGSSRTLAVGPVGLISLLVGSTIVEMGLLGDEKAITVAVTLALMSGALLLLMRMMHLGSVINFISHPVLSGFTSAAAILIALTQVKHLLGLEMPRTIHIQQSLSNIAQHIGETNMVTASLGITCVVIIFVTRSKWLPRVLAKRVPKWAVDVITRSGPIIVVVSGVFISWLYSLNNTAGVSIVGAIPSGLPPFSIPGIDLALCQELLPIALLITIVGYLESVSVSKVLASRRRQKIDANQELLAHGVANIGAALSAAYPTAGGFGRSMVNFTTGANTPLASFITAILVALALLFFTPLLFHLPHAVLAAIIVMAVAGLVDVKMIKHTWSYDKADTVALILTFLIVLTVGIELGILAGTCLSIGLYLHRSSRPHMAIVGRVGDSEHFRNVNRFEVKTCPHVIALRVDENLYFSNTNFLEDTILNLVADHQAVNHFVLVCSAINYIDTSALEALDNIVERLASADVVFHLAEVKGPVMDGLKKTPFLSRMQPGKVFLSTHEAMVTLRCV